MKKYVSFYTEYVIDSNFNYNELLEINNSKILRFSRDKVIELLVIII